MQKEMNKCAVQVFVFLMRKTINSGFSFPGGGLATKTVNECLNSLENLFGSIGRDLIVDFCICQVHVISCFHRDYLSKWNPSHSFGKKAIERFTDKKSRAYFENRWLKDHRLSREYLKEQFQDRSLHPLFSFIYPEYEDRTKKRLLNTSIGFYICNMSTLLWTPFSPVCKVCLHAESCKGLTKQKYGELYRIRIEEFNKGGGYGK